MSTFGHNKTLRRPPPDKPEIAKRAALGKRRRKRDQDDTLPPSTRVRGMSEQRSAAADEGASLDHPAADEILQQNIQRRRDSTESQTPSTREPKGFKRIDDDGVNELKKPPVKELTRTSVEGALGFGPKDERYRKIFLTATKSLPRSTGSTTEFGLIPKDIRDKAETDLRDAHPILKRCVDDWGTHYFLRQVWKQFRRRWRKDEAKGKVDPSPHGEPSSISWTIPTNPDPEAPFSSLQIVSNPTSPGGTSSRDRARLLAELPQSGAMEGLRSASRGSSRGAALEARDDDEREEDAEDAATGSKRKKSAPAGFWDTVIQKPPHSKRRKD